MCLIIFNWAPSSQTPLTLAANRDEFHQRPSLDAQFWQDDPGIFAGRDLEKGGTWLGLSKNKSQNTFRLAAITNFRSLDSNKYQHSRGEISQHFLTSSETASAYAKQINVANYAGFNGLFFDGISLVYCHSEKNKKPEILTLSPGTYGLSNAKLNTPWPKVERTKAAFSSIDKAKPAEAISEALIACLTDTHLAEDSELPNTGVGVDLERMLSPAFIISPSYGTRTSTAVIINQAADAQSVLFRERQYSPKGQKKSELIKALSI